MLYSIDTVERAQAPLVRVRAHGADGARLVFDMHAEWMAEVAAGADLLVQFDAEDRADAPRARLRGIVAMRRESEALVSNGGLMFHVTGPDAAHLEYGREVTTDLIPRPRSRKRTSRAR